MELTHLKYFIAVAEELHFGRAALRLNIAQPPLSQQIKRLEDELDLKLFKRTSRKVNLTEAGQVFYEEAKSVVGRAEGAKKRMEDLALGRRGSLSIGFNSPAMQRVLAKALKRHMELFPDVELRLIELGSHKQFEALDKGELDIALLRPYGRELLEYDVQLLFQDEYIAVLPKEHRLSSKNELHLADFSSDSLVMFSKEINPELYDDLLEIIRAAGASPTIVQEAASKNTMLALVEAGVGWGLVPKESMKKSAYDVEFIPIKDVLPKIDICAVTTSGTKPKVLQDFLKTVDDIKKAGV
ncbi:MAG: LysR family transcriptional regulator [Lentisphaerae bacterium]|nr:LysR family transcriptional regulator [Lentisphaerota bacterium]MCP4102738.1 LysR family transcriptional regulator [Lentisphaerota bacterium]